MAVERLEDEVNAIKEYDKLKERRAGEYVSLREALRLLGRMQRYF